MAARLEGYGCEFIEKPPKAVQSECPICLLVLREPYQATCCGKSFCKECIERVKTNNQPCPTCNEIKRFNVFHNLGLQQLLYDIQVCCTYSSKGCEWRGELRELDKHLNSEPPTDKSLEGCQFALIKCPLDCKGCEKGIPRDGIESHVKDNLANLVVKQGYRVESFEQEIRSKLWEIDQRLGKRVAELENKVGEVLEKNKQLEEEIKLLKTNQLPGPSTGQSGLAAFLGTGQSSLHDTSLTGSFKPIGAEFTMPDFKTYKSENDVWYSSHFYTHPNGYKMCLGVVANGAGISKGTHVSVFMHILRGEFDDRLKWPLNGSFVIQILDQVKDTAEHITRMVNCTGNLAGRVTKGLRSSPLGVHNFVSHADLRAEYLNNNSLKLRVKKVVLF